MGGIACVLGASLIRPSAGTVPWAELGILAAMMVAAIVGATEARRIVAKRSEAAEETAAPVEGQWMTVMIGEKGAGGTSGQIARPKAPPRNDPERRSLARRARERRQAVGAGR